MESETQRIPTTFAVLHYRLLSLVLRRLNNGEITERTLARVVGVSQPQIHNVLKGKRRLQPELADRLLEKFGLAIEDLVAMEASKDDGVDRPPRSSPSVWPEALASSLGSGTVRRKGPARAGGRTGDVRRSG